MACLCGTEGEIKRGKLVLCNFCFLDQFEKRVKKALRERKLCKGESVLVLGDVAAFLFKKFVHVPLNVEFEQKGDYDAVIIEWTMDDECVTFLEAFAGDLQLKDDGRIKMFKFVSDEDVVLYAKMKGLEFVPRAKNEHWQKFLEKFDLDMKYNLLRNVGEMRELLK